MAIDWSDILSLGLNIGAGAVGYENARKAGSTAASGAQQAAAGMMPWLNQGTWGVNELKNKIAAGPGEFTKSPGYEFRLNEGLRGLQQSAAAKGKLLSGQTLKGMERYSQDYASNEYDKWLNQWYESLKPYQTLSGQGIVAGTPIGNWNYQGAQNTAAGQIGQANALAQLLTWGAKQYGDQGVITNLLKTLGLGGGNGGSLPESVTNGLGSWDEYLGGAGGASNAIPFYQTSRVGGQVGTSPQSSNPLGSVLSAAKTANSLRNLYNTGSELYSFANWGGPGSGLSSGTAATGAGAGAGAGGATLTEGVGAMTPEMIQGMYGAGSSFGAGAGSGATTTAGAGVGASAGTVAAMYAAVAAYNMLMDKYTADKQWSGTNPFYVDDLGLSGAARMTPAEMYYTNLRDTINQQQGSYGFPVDINAAYKQALGEHADSNWLNADWLANEFQRQTGMTPDRNTQDLKITGMYQNWLMNQPEYRNIYDTLYKNVNR